MNPKDVLLHHLSSLMSFSGAKNISVFHPQVSDKMGEVVVGEFENDELPLTQDFDFEHPGVIQFNSRNSDIVYIVLDQKTVLIKISEYIIAELPTPVRDATGSDNQSSDSKSRRAPIQSFSTTSFFWMKVTFESAIPSWFDQNMQQGVPEEIEKMASIEQMLESASMQIRLIGDYLALLSDPLTNLNPRTVMQNKIALLSQNYSVGLVMLHCIDFHQINKKFGHEFGDNVIREIATELKSVTREADILSRFGGALFGVAFPANEKTDVASLAKKLQRVLQQKQYLDGAINLQFDLGAAIVEHDEKIETESERASTLINRTDQALKVAQQENQPSIITWQKDDFNLYQQQFNYLGGIFTADTITDYRNMLLLWDISSLIADKYDLTQLCQSVVQRLAQTFDFSCAGIISDDELDQMSYKFSIDEADNAVALNTKDHAFLSEIKQMKNTVLDTKKPSERYVGSSLLLVLPLEIETEDCFFICGNAEHFEVKHDTKVLLSGLTRQLGKALRRSRLEEELNRKLESQNEQLQNELAQLKEGLQVSSIIYRSQAMENLMKQAKRAALTDTTVLVTGESGTGKERLINALHTMGNRGDKPFVIVDCGSIPETLIESELFGYVKGAFTGAQNTSQGKVLDANGGILVLDEIGELPLNMQTKLLRFVQEKHFTPVGGNKVIEVDVKIIAVTNRDLAQEVELGTFRKDLYYRLNVLTLHNPPLRERVEDIALLSSHFLAKFAEQFKVEKRVLSDTALRRMAEYSWPGNIRELENRLMQATLLSEGQVIEWELLNIEDDAQHQAQNGYATTNGLPSPPVTPVMQSNGISDNNANSTPAQNGQVTHQPPPTAPIHQTEQHSGPQFISSDDCLAYLLELFKQQLAAAGQHPQFFNAPFGNWIEDELIIKTYLATDRKMRQTAARLSISQSTARRKVDKILAEMNQNNQHRPDNWHQITDALMPIAEGKVFIANCVAKIKLLVLEGILSTPVYSMAQAAEMLGVSEPTFYKLKRELDALN